MDEARFEACVCALEAAQSEAECAELSARCLNGLSAVGGLERWLGRVSRAWSAWPGCGELGDLAAACAAEARSVDEAVRQWPTTNGEDAAVANALWCVTDTATFLPAAPRGPEALEAWSALAYGCARRSVAAVSARLDELEGARGDSRAARRARALAALAGPVGLAQPFSGLTADFWAVDFESRIRHWRRAWFGPAPAVLELKRTLASLAECGPRTPTIEIALAAVDDTRQPSPGTDFASLECERDGAGCNADAVGPTSTTVVLVADARYRVCNDFRRSLQSILGLGCSVNLYSTPPGAQGLDVHLDDHCVFVVQLYGRKRWRFYGCRVDRPRLLCQRLSPPPEILRDGPLRVLDLEPGDVLYVPRGVYHAATALGSLDRSVHCTIGLDLDPAFAWEGTFHALLLAHEAPPAAHAAIKLVAEDDADLRSAALPALLLGPAETTSDGAAHRLFFDRLAPRVAAALDSLPPEGTPASVAEFRWWLDCQADDVVVRRADAERAATLIRRFGTSAGIDALFAWQRRRSLEKLEESARLAEFFLRLDGR